MVVVKEQRYSEVSSAFREEVVVVSHLNSVDVSKRRVVSEHLDVEESNDVLLHLEFRDVRFGDSSF